MIREKAIIGFNSFAKDALICFSGAFFAYYLTDIIEISPIFMGWLFLITRGIDAFVTLLVGYLFEKSYQTDSKIKWLYGISAICYAVAFPLLFLKVVDSQLLLALYLSIVYFIYDISQTIAEIAFWTWLPQLTRDSDGRARLIAIARFCASLAALVSISSGLTLAKFLGQGNLQMGLFKSSFLLSILLLLAVLLQLKYLKLPRPSFEERSEYRFRDSLSLLLKNKPLLYLFVVLLLFELGIQLMNAMNLYYFKYVLGDVFYFSLYVFTIVVQMLGSLVYMKLKPYMTNHQIFYLAGIITVTGLGLLFVSGHFWPQSALLVFLTGSIKQFGTGLYMVSGTVAITSCMDYSEKQLGSSQTSLAVALQNFSLNLALAISAWLVGLGLSLFGYSPNQLQSQLTLNGIRWLTCLLPILFILLAHWLYRYRFEQSLTQKA